MSAVEFARERCNAPARSPIGELYTTLGWSVIPVNGSTKSPLVPWKAFAERRPTEVEIKTWASRFSGCGIAVITGPVSKIVVLDADGQDAIDEAIRRGIPKTPTVSTPRGGAHFYFRLPADRSMFKNAVKLGESKKLDIRGRAGYVVAPNTRRADGKRYEWVERPDRVALAAPPKWLYDLARTAPDEEPRPMKIVPPRKHDGSGDGGSPPDIFERARQHLATMPEAISGDGGHKVTYAAVVAMVRGFSLTTDEAMELLLEEFNPRCDPPWSERELRYKCESAEASSPLPDGYLVDTLDYERRLVSIKFADPTESPGGVRIYLCFESADGEPIGELRRNAITVQSRPTDRVRGFCDALGISMLTLETARNASKSLVGRKLVLEIDPERKPPNSVRRFLKA